MDEIMFLLTPTFLRQHVFAQDKRKVNFGISLYGQQSHQYRDALNKLGLSLKKSLQKENVSARLVMNTDGPLSSVQVTKNYLIERGAEILIIMGVHACYIGVTAAVQDFEDYSQRDYDRPQRDARSGMLPPKLAKIMLNVSGAHPDQKLLDPFCGSGTIIQESLLLGWQDVIGSDISEKAIADSTENVRWLHKRYPQLKGAASFSVVDVATLAQHMPIDSIDAIVTEPYLGPPIRQEPEVIEMLTIIQELESLYLSAFRAFAQILKYHGRIVIVFPLFKTRHGIYSLKILETLQAMGFERLSPIPDRVSLFTKVGPTARGSLIYHREGQRVERELFLFEYKKPRSV